MKHSVEQIKLSNGAEGLFIHVPRARVMSYEFNFRAGEYLVERDKWEVPHLMEHVILGANKRYRDARGFQAELQKNGAYTNAYTSYYSVSYVGEVADVEWDRVIKLQLLALAQPLFLLKEFKAEWGNIRDELTAYCNNHFRHLGGELGKTFGFTNPTDAERIKLMKSAVRKDLVEHWKRTHLAANMRFVIAGNLRGRRDKLRQIIENCGLPAGTARFALPAETAKKPEKPVYIHNETVPNMYLYIDTYASDIINQEEDDALSLARIMLTETLHSRIFGQAREKGLVYSVNSNHYYASAYSEWWLSAQVIAANAPALCDIILKEVKNVQDGKIDVADLKAAKQYALGSFQRSMQTVGSVANAYGRYFFDDHIENIDSIPSRIKSIKKEQMAAAMQHLFSENIGNIGVLGTAGDRLVNSLNRQLESLWK